MSNQLVCERVKANSSSKAGKHEAFLAWDINHFQRRGRIGDLSAEVLLGFSWLSVILLPKLVSLLQGEWLSGGHASLLRSSSLSQMKHGQKDTAALRREEHRVLTVGIPADRSTF